MITLISAQTAAVTTDSVILEYSDVITVVAHGLGTEEIDVQIQYNDAGSFEDVYDYYDEDQVTLKSTRNTVVISAPGVYQFVKPITASAVTLSYHRSSRNRG